MPLVTIEHVTDLDYQAVRRELVSFIRGFFRAAGARGLVVGVSGGVDSATTLALAVDAVGADRVLALIMPDTRVTPEEDVRDALEVVKAFGVEHVKLEIDAIVDAFVRVAGEASKKTVGNLRARVRMALLYYHANERNLLVTGTGDRSELSIGYFTKYGDGGVDFLPIGVLYKTQVRRLAVELGVPRRIAEKPSSPRLWEGHMAEEELGVSYVDVDTVLFALLDLGLPPKKAAEVTGKSVEVVERVCELMNSAKHKQVPLPMPSLEAVYAHWPGLEKAREALRSRA